jgi:hypothetical protein
MRNAAPCCIALQFGEPAASWLRRSAATHLGSTAAADPEAAALAAPVVPEDRRFWPEADLAATCRMSAVRGEARSIFSVRALPLMALLGPPGMSVVTSASGGEPENICSP